MSALSRFTPVGIAVVVALVVMSLVSLAVIVDRWRAFRRVRRLSRTSAESVGRLLREGRSLDAASAARSQNDPQAHLARVLATGLQEWEQMRPLEPDADAAAFAVREAVRQATSLSLEEMRRGLAALATIGSTAPFVGLLGTTFGILTAFSDMARLGVGGFAVIASSISEALVTTALGLGVAIPAVWAYNTFLRRIEGLGIELDRSGYQLVRHLRREAAGHAVER